ncbi:hypothetical protein [Sphingomonas sp. 37zxx]|uniref:hypothetical protein n=1 Tax=Sphingomonas sp. 37zxx TaxID=1550073 RepID=UPI00053BDB0F|nr:hypothetical protein [Sphingomonas sp. 37zxx]
MQAWFWTHKAWVAVAALLAVALLAGVAEHRRTRRADWDRVGVVYWPSVQMFALIGAFIAALLAIRG